MFNHKIRPVSGHLKAEFITPEELALRVRARRKRRIMVALLCTSMLAGASVLVLHKGKAQTAGAQGAGDAIVAVGDLAWPDGTELDAVIPTAGSNGETKVALDTALDAMALQQLAMLAPEAGSGEGSGETPPEGGAGDTGGSSGESGWGTGPNFTSNPSDGTNPPSGDTGRFSPMSFSSGPSGGGTGDGSNGDGDTGDGVCDPSNPSDVDCTTKTDGSDTGPTASLTTTDSSDDGKPKDGETCLLECPSDDGSEGEGLRETATAVPEPASLALFGAALTAFGIARRRRKS